MLSDFKIEKFRHFESIEINKIRRVNLYVGKNSAGKSALLEALLLFFTQMSLKYLPKIHSNRQEDWEQAADIPGHTPLRHLFKNHQLPLPGEQGFTLSSTHDDRSFSVRIESIRVSREGLTTGMESLVLPQTREYTLPYEQLMLIMEKGDHKKLLFELQDYPPRRPSLMYRSQNSAPLVNFVSTSGISNSELATLWDSISLTEAEGEIIKGLQLIEPNVEAVAFVGRSSSRTALVKLSNEIEPVTLKSLGDGMSRILQIIVSLVNAKGGVLIIDEFENGLHWSVQADVWKLVFKLSAILNVQVFATTHSRDCIYGFEEAWATEQNAGGFARLQKTSNSVKISEYSFTMLRDSLETDVEVR
jgi:predicted ATPase